MAVGVDVAEVGEERGEVYVWEGAVDFYGLAVGVHAEFFAAELAVAAADVVVDLAYCFGGEGYFVFEDVAV